MNPVEAGTNLRVVGKRKHLIGPTAKGSVAETKDLTHNAQPNRRGYLYKFKTGCKPTGSSKGRPPVTRENPFTRERQVRNFSALAEAIGRAVNRPPQ